MTGRKMNEKQSIVVMVSTILTLLVSFTTAQGDQSNYSCQNLTCAADQECRLVQVQCFRAPCYPVPQCLPACSPLSGCNLNCSNGWVKDNTGCNTCQCRVCGPDPCPGMFCLYGREKDADGCMLCPCYQPCMEVDCPTGTQCQVEKNSTPDSYYGRCVPIVTNAPCAKVQCTNNCRLGYRSDSNGCQTCDCFDPCQSYRCPDGQRCVLTADDCPPGAECRDAPMPYCTDAVSPPTSSKAPETTNTSSCPPLINCGLNCSKGWMKDSRGCDTCQCICDPDPCLFLLCLYGKMKDADGCPLCPCYQPCFDVSCASDQECQVVKNPTTDTYIGSCVAKVTRPPCYQVRCSNYCPYSFKYDDNGCQTCNCYDPCENYPCDPNEHCVMSADDCPPGNECRDAPMPYCVESFNSSSSSSSTTTTTTTLAPASTFAGAGRGEGNVLQCCIDAGISATCLPFCTSNFTQSLQNYQLLTGCYQYLGKFLKCESGGRSFESCCRGRGVIESCVYLCSGDDQVDVSDPSQVTQCIMTSSQMVADCLSNGIPDTTPTTSSSTSSANFCLMGPDPGPCSAQLDRWYYSAASRACALFTYGGCGGNGNNFETKEACVGTCGTSGSRCPEVMCEPRCRMAVDQFGCNTCSCPTDCFSLGCPEYQRCMMMPGSCANGTNCPLTPRCVSSPDVPCDQLNCTLSCPNRWMTNARGCPICQCKQCEVICPLDLVCPYGRAKGSDGCDTCQCYEPCQGVTCPSGQCQAVLDDSTGIYLPKCLDATTVTPGQRPASCHLTPDYGLSCRENSTRWYYNSTADRCIPFPFGGCLGNDNNFQTMDVCDAICRQGSGGSVTCRPFDCDPFPVCDYGLKKDAGGCLTCQCLDPCEGVVCPVGQTCVSQKCSDVQMCPQQYTRQCMDSSSTSTTSVAPSVCSKVMCRMYCPLGFEKDSNGCEICKCYDPCKNCTANQTCVTMSIDCPMSSSPCPYSMAGYCLDQIGSTTSTPSSTTTPSASTTSMRCLLCMQRCTYGMLKDSRGCAACKCYDPCQNLTCPGNSSCLVVRLTNLCPQDVECSPDLLYKGQCSTATMSTTTPAVSRGVTRTTPKPCVVCQIYCEYGMQMGANGCPLCQCKNPCMNVTCSGGDICRVVTRIDGEFVGQCSASPRTTGVLSSSPSSVTTTSVPTSAKTSWPKQCMKPLCPGPPCIYGASTDENGCLTCTCLPSPCQNISCSNSNEICQTILNCPSDRCQYPTQTVCVDRTRPCEDLEVEYQRLYMNSVGRMPQLNCDSNGRFKPTQCHGDLCWCVDNDGTQTTTKFSQSTINCYNGSQILLETVRIDANFNVIKPEDGWKFKQQLGQQMANLLSIAESLVTIMKYKEGSIIAQLAIASNEDFTMTSTEQKLNNLRTQTFDISYDNATYRTQFYAEPPTDLPSTTQPMIIITELPRHDTDNKGTPSRLLMIILVCVFVPIAFLSVAITVWLACKVCRNQRMIPPKPLKSGTSAAEVSSVESGSEKSYSNDSTKSDSSKKVLTRDTTEA